MDLFLGNMFLLNEHTEGADKALFFSFRLQI